MLSDMRVRITAEGQWAKDIHNNADLREACVAGRPVTVPLPAGAGSVTGIVYSVDFTVGLTVGREGVDDGPRATVEIIVGAKR